MSVPQESSAPEHIRDHKLDSSQSSMCGVTMSESVEGRVIADLFEGRPGVTVTRYPAMIRIDAEDRMTFDMDEISEALGRDMDPYTFQIEMSTHYGRMGIIDDRTVVLFGKLDDYMEAVGAYED